MRLTRRSRQSSSEEVTRLFFATDIHGSDRCFRKFLNAARFYSAKYLVLGGDITGKTLVPIERKGDTYSVMLDGRRHDGLSEEQRAAVERQLRDRGQYPVVGEADLLGRLDDEEAREEIFVDVIRESVGGWVEMAEERLAGTGVRCFITPGNDDFFEIDDALRGGTAVEFVEGQRVILDDGREMITTGYSNPTPWRTPRELDEEALAERIRGMSDGAKDPASMVMVLHPPPHGTLLDQAPALDDELNIEMRGGAVQMMSVGSLAVRQVIEEVQPLLTLHGHVHESPAEQKLGRTLCINPGSEYTTGILRGALIGLSRDGIAAHQMVSG